jgi:hypothetical protein
MGLRLLSAQAPSALDVAPLGLLRQSRELAKLLTATLAALGGEREDVLEPHPPVGPDPVVRDPALLEQLHKTRTEYRRDLEKLVTPYFAGFRLDEIAASDVKDWQTWMERRGCSPSAIRKAKAVLSAMLGDAAEEGKIAHNPAHGVRYAPRTPLRGDEKPRDLTTADLAKFLDAVEPDGGCSSSYSRTRASGSPRRWG